MSKAILEKSGLKEAGKFVSPSVATDHSVSAPTPSLPSFNFNSIGWREVTGALVGLYLVKKFPKTTILGALAYGTYFGYSKVGTEGIKQKIQAVPELLKNAKPAAAANSNPFQGEGLADI